MYNLVSAIGKSNDTNSRWANLDIAHVSLSELYHLYSKLYVTLTNSFSPTVKVTLDLDSIRTTQIANTLSFSDYLASLGNAVLPTSTTLYEIDTQYAHYNDARRAHYKIELVGQDGHINSPLPNPDRDWLSIKRPVSDYPGFDYHLLQRSVLVTVNGLVHLSDTDGSQLLIIDGGKSGRIAGLNNVGLTSLRGLGNLEFVPITADMVHRRFQDVPMSQTLYLDVGEDRPAQTAILVLGGYLHVLDDFTFRRESDSIFSVNIQNFPLLERYFESRDLIDLTPLGLDIDANNPNTINSQELYSDAVLTKYATLSQSFLVFIDTVNLFTEYESLRRSSIPCKAISYVEPAYPIVVGCGLLADYWRVKEDGQWAITMTRNWQSNYQFTTTDRSNWQNINDARLPENPQDIGRAQFLKIGADLIKTVGA